MGAKLISEGIEEVVEDVIEEVAEEVAEEDSNEEEQDEESEEEEKPEWLNPSEESDTPDEPGSVPLASHLREKRKLKGRVTERDAEIESLKSELEKIKSSVQSPPEPSTLKRPRSNDFDTEEDYEDALDAYEVKRDESLKSSVFNVNTQKLEQEKLQQNIASSVDEHYSRAEKLVKQYSIDPAVYKAADSNVRKAVEAIRPQQGDDTVDYLISQIDEDSEKVMLAIGNNPKKLAELQNALVNDPRGIKLAIFLGRQQEIVKTNKKLTSNAPKPAVHVSGNVVSATKSGAEKKKFDEAQRKGNDQLAYNIMRTARKEGINTKEW